MNCIRCGGKLIASRLFQVVFGVQGARQVWICVICGLGQFKPIWWGISSDE